MGNDHLDGAASDGVGRGSGAAGSVPTEALPAETVEALAQALEDAHAAGEPVDALAETAAHGEVIKAEIIGDEAGRVVIGELLCTN